MAMIRQMELLLILHSRANGRWREEDDHADCAGAGVEGAEGKLAYYCQMIQSHSP